MNSSDQTFFTLFGTKEFVPLMNVVQKYAPSNAFSAVAYQMFHYLFNWDDTEWDNAYKTAYFNCTPRPTSTKALLHWFQVAKNGSVLKPFVSHELEIEKERTDSAATSQNEDTFDLKCIQCPLALIYGEKDQIVDAKKLIFECNDSEVDLIMQECVEGYEHMDVVWGKHAKERVFDKLLIVLRKLEQQSN